MKHVAKGKSPDSFEHWKKQQTEDWEPTYANLQNPEKQDLRTALVAEQGWVCCYCGRTIGMDDSHVEHFRPQDEYKDLQLDFMNLFASCVRQGVPKLPRHCGHAKDSDFSEAEHISPLDPRCERRFMYTALGEIQPATEADAQAVYMADLLALNTPLLREGRREALSRVYDPAFLATATPEELEILRTAFTTRDGHGKLPNYGHVLARYAEQWTPAPGPDVKEQPAQATMP